MVELPEVEIEFNVWKEVIKLKRKTRDCTKFVAFRSSSGTSNVVDFNGTGKSSRINFTSLRYEKCWVPIGERERGLCGGLF